MPHAKKSHSPSQAKCARPGFKVCTQKAVAHDPQTRVRQRSGNLRKGIQQVRVILGLEESADRNKNLDIAVDRE